MEPKKVSAKRSPVVWLTVFEGAQQRGDAVLAERARKELKRLGVLVGRRSRRGGKGVSGAK
jgi:hypothetical protein